MINSTTFVKTITNAQMAWLINTKKVWFVESEGMYFSRNYCYTAVTPSMENQQGGWEVHS
jgi:hypothetical protein